MGFKALIWNVCRWFLSGTAFPGLNRLLFPAMLGQTGQWQLCLLLPISSYCASTKGELTVQQSDYRKTLKLELGTIQVGGC